MDQLTFVTPPDQSRRHGFFDDLSCRVSILPGCLLACHRNMALLSAEPAAHDGALLVLAAELLVLRHWWVLGRIRAERARFEVLDARHAEAGFDLDAFESHEQLLVQEKPLLVPGEACGAAGRGHASQVGPGEADLRLGQTSGAAVAERVGQLRVAAHHSVLGSLLPAALAFGNGAILLGLVRVARLVLLELLLRQLRLRVTLGHVELVAGMFSAEIVVPKVLRVQDIVQNLGHFLLAGKLRILCAWGKVRIERLVGLEEDAVVAPEHSVHIVCIGVRKGNHQ